MTPFGIAGIQMNLQHGNNVDAIEEKINLLMCLYPWVEMVIVSELAAHGPLDSFAETMPGITEERFCTIAKKHNIWLIPGSFFELKNDAIFNTAPVINPQGEVIARHRKLFPFRPFEEGVEAGDEFVVFDVPGAGRFGLCICYDMWFPEVLRTLTSMGAEVILHPVLTGTNDRDIELNLARSSGALFQSYIIDINGLGVGGIGQSCIVDPAGRVVYQAGATDEFLVTELDFDSVRRQREVGLRNLGQPLKSFRDSNISFTVYNKTQQANNYLNSLGPLQKATRQNKKSMATEPAFIVNSELNSTLTSALTSELSSDLNSVLSTNLSSDFGASLTDDMNAEFNTPPDITDYNNLTLTPTAVTPPIVTAQDLPLELIFEESEPVDAIPEEQFSINQPEFTTADGSKVIENTNSESIGNSNLENEAESKLTQTADSDANTYINANNNNNTNINSNTCTNANTSDTDDNRDEKSKGDNLKWLKEASTQIKQYIKS